MSKVSTFYVRVKRDRRPYSEVIAENPVLMYGEMQIVYNVDDDPRDRIKIGNGRDSFSELPWYEDTGALSKVVKAQPNGVATLDAEGIIPLEQIPDDLRTPVTPVTLQDVVYNGQMQSPVVVSGEDTDGQVLTGITQARDVGTYMIAAKPSPGCVWDDGTTDTKFLQWEIIPDE